MSKMKSNLPNTKYKIQNTEHAITLLALIITVIVLLILAMVSIRLVMNGGIINRIGKGIESYSEAEIGEQIKLACSEYKMKQFEGTTDTAEKIIGDRLKETLEDENLTVKVANGKITVNTTIKGKSKTFIYKTSTGESYEYKDPFDYGTKTTETLVPGDDIILGTEKFRVFYNQDGVIKAMPFYNLKLDSVPMRQATAATMSTAGTSQFSTSNYWSKGDNEINMNDSRNKIQQYIFAYANTLENLGADIIQVRVARFSEINENGMTNSLKNPGQSGNYWLGSGYPSDADSIRYVYYYGDFGAQYYNWSYGVRPIIIIEY